MCRALKERLLTAKATEKLPTIYLIDSIMKNSADYVDRLAPFLEQLFVDSYLKVDDGTKAKFIKVLGTWDSVIPADLKERISVRITGKKTRESARIKESSVKSSRQPVHPYKKKPDEENVKFLSFIQSSIHHITLIR